MIAPLPGARHRIRKRAQRAKRVLITIWPLALARPGDIQRADLVCANKVTNPPRRCVG